MYHEFELYLRGLELWKDQVWTHVLRFDKVEAVAQDGEPRYYSFPTTEDVHAFFDRGIASLSFSAHLLSLSNTYSLTRFKRTNSLYEHISQHRFLIRQSR